MPMVRRADQHDVQVLLLEHLPIVGVSPRALMRFLSPRHHLRRLRKPVLIHIAQRDDFNRRNLDQPKQIILAIPSRPDQPHAIRLLLRPIGDISAQHGGRNSRRAHLQKISSVHGNPSSLSSFCLGGSISIGFNWKMTKFVSPCRFLTDMRAPHVEIKTIYEGRGETVNSSINWRGLSQLVATGESADNKPSAWPRVREPPKCSKRRSLQSPAAEACRRRNRRPRPRAAFRARRLMKS